MPAEVSETHPITVKTKDVLPEKKKEEETDEEDDGLADYCCCFKYDLGIKIIGIFDMLSFPGFIGTAFYFYQVCLRNDISLQFELILVTFPAITAFFASIPRTIWFIRLCGRQDELIKRRGYWRARGFSTFLILLIDGIYFSIVVTVYLGPKVFDYSKGDIIFVNSDDMKLVVVSVGLVFIFGVLADLFLTVKVRNYYLKLLNPKTPAKSPEKSLAEIEILSKKEDELRGKTEDNSPMADRSALRYHETDNTSFNPNVSSSSLHNS